jgi:hypothetical protein
MIAALSLALTPAAVLKKTKFASQSSKSDVLMGSYDPPPLPLEEVVPI